MFWRNKIESIDTSAVVNPIEDVICLEDRSNLPESIKRIISKNQSHLTQKEHIELAEYFRQIKDWGGIAYMNQLLPTDVNIRHAAYAKLDRRRDPQTVKEAIEMLAKAGELRRKRERRFRFGR